MFKLGWAIALIATLGALVAPAQAQTVFEVPGNASWKHAETGVILRPRIAGIPRGTMKDASKSELDISAQYESPDGQLYITVFIYRPALSSLPVWFDRSETAILMRDLYGKARPVSAAPTAFARPGATTASGLRQVYLPSSGVFKSTALAMMPIGKWLVAVRISAKDLDAAQIDARMTEVIAGIGWPKDVAESPVAVPVAPCAERLAYAKGARMKKPDMQDGLIAGSAIALAAGKEGGTPPLYCRDLPPALGYGVYREPTETDGYVMAIGDAGIMISIGPDMFAEGKPRFRMFAGFLDHHAIYSTFDKLPHPDDAMRAIRGVAPAARVSLDGKNIELSM